MTTKDNSIINAKLLQEYNLQYLKENNDLITSVKKETAKQLILSSVSQRSELFFAVLKWAKQADLDYPNDMLIDDFEKYEANNCG